MTLIERLRALGQRRKAEGIYTDQNICEAAIEEIKNLRMLLRQHARRGPHTIESEWMKVEKALETPTV